MTDLVEPVSQAARDAAAKLLGFRGECSSYTSSIERGEQDNGDSVQAFARFEASICASDKARIDELEAALRPFAEEGDALDEITMSDNDLWESPHALNLTIGDLRLADRTLHQEPKP